MNIDPLAPRGIERRSIVPVVTEAVMHRPELNHVSANRAE